MPMKEAVIEALAEVVEGCKAMVGVCEGFPDMAAEPSVRDCMKLANDALDKLERATKIAPEPRSDIPQFHPIDVATYPHEWFEVHDADYRRGYYQGWYGALTAIQNGATERRVETFLYGPLLKWRYETDLGKVVFPPEIGDPTITERNGKR